MGHARAGRILPNVLPEPVHQKGPGGTNVFQEESRLGVTARAQAWEESSLPALSLPFLFSYR